MLGPLKKIAIAVCIASTYTLSTSTAAGGLKSQMDSIFNEMTNSTPAGVYETQRRGVMSGGRYTVKSKISEVNLISMTPPSFKAGCGGIDMYGGSLSFINADQIVQILRSVAANAKGYAFQLALDNVFPDGAKWIEAFQKKIQELNQHMGNSCMMAQGLMDLEIGGHSASSIMENQTAGIRNNLQGISDDWYDSIFGGDGKNATEKLEKNNPEEAKKLVTGNIVWRQLKEQNVQSWYVLGDKKLLEQLMSLTGTVIINESVPDPNIAGSNPPSTNPIEYLSGHIITLKNLVDGANDASYYECDTEDQCLNPTTLNNQTVSSLKEKYQHMMTGTSSNIGLINKFAQNYPGELLNEERAFLANLPPGVGTIIRNLSVVSPNSARMFAAQAAGSIALESAYRLTQDFFKSVTIALTTSQSSQIPKVLVQIYESRRAIDQEYRSLSTKYGNIASLINHYNELLDTTRKQNYMSQTLTKKESL